MSIGPTPVDPYVDVMPDVFIFNIRLLVGSPIYILPSESKASPLEFDTVVANIVDTPPGVNLIIFVSRLHL